jgi:hypothetical protein
MSGQYFNNNCPLYCFNRNILFKGKKAFKINIKLIF